LRGQQRVAVGRYIYIGEQPHPSRRGGEEAERGHDVVPDRGHGRRLGARHADVVAGCEVEEAALVARLGDAADLCRCGRLLPRLGEGRALRRARELETVLETDAGDDGDGGHFRAASRMRVVEWTGSVSKRGITCLPKRATDSSATSCGCVEARTPKIS